VEVLVFVLGRQGFWQAVEVYLVAVMRHASIKTTMNVYGQAMPASKREANGKVVEKVLKPMKASA
jgi:hypothetical protein